MRPVMMRPRNGLASRIVPIMRNGPGCDGRLRNVLQHEVEQRRKALVLRAFRVDGHPAVAARTVEDREVELLVGGVERREQVEDFVDDFDVARIRAVDLVDRDDRPRPTFSALPTTNLVCGIGPSAASTSTIAPSTIDRMRSTSPPKSAWPGVSTMLMRVSFQSTEVALARMVMPRSFSSRSNPSRVQRRAGFRGTNRTVSGARRPASFCHGQRAR